MAAERKYGADAVHAAEGGGWTLFLAGTPATKNRPTILSLDKAKSLVKKEGNRVFACFRGQKGAQKPKKAKKAKVGSASGFPASGGGVGTASGFDSGGGGVGTASGFGAEHGGVGAKKSRKAKKSKGKVSGSIGSTPGGMAKAKEILLHSEGVVSVTIQAPNTLIVSLSHDSPDVRERLKAAVSGVYKGRLEFGVASIGKKGKKTMPAKKKKTKRAAKKKTLKKKKKTTKRKTAKKASVSGSPKKKAAKKRKPTKKKAAKKKTTKRRSKKKSTKVSGSTGSMAIAGKKKRKSRKKRKSTKKVGTVGTTIEVVGKKKRRKSRKKKSGKVGSSIGTMAIAGKKSKKRKSKKRKSSASGSKCKIFKDGKYYVAICHKGGKYYGCRYSHIVSATKVLKDLAENPSGFKEVPASVGAKYC